MQRLISEENAAEPAAVDLAQEAAQRLHLVRQASDGAQGSALASQGLEQRHLSGKLESSVLYFY